MEMSFTGSALIIKKQFAENWARYLLGAIAMLIILIVFIMMYSSSRITGLGMGDIGATLQITSLLFGGIYVVSLFDVFRGKKRWVWLTLPVSPADRLAGIVLLSVFIFPVVFCAVFAATLFIAKHLGHALSKEVTFEAAAEMFRQSVGYWSRFALSQSVVAVLAVMYRRFTYLKATITFFVLFTTFSITYRACIKQIFGLPRWRSDITDVNVAEYPENWKDNEAVTVKFLQVSKDDKGHVSKRMVKDKVSGEIWGTMFGFVGISIASHESAIMPVSRYFEGRITGTITDGQRLGFSVMYFVGMIALWVVVWLRLKEAQL